MFGFDYEELAEAVGKSQAAIRQIAHRARGHVTARRPRVAVTRGEAQDVVAAFRRALETGDLQRMARTAGAAAR